MYQAQSVKWHILFNNLAIIPLLYTVNGIYNYQLNSVTHFLFVKLKYFMTICQPTI